MSGEDLLLARHGPWLVMGEVHPQVRGGQVLLCTRALDVVNAGTRHGTLHSVTLHAGGERAALFPPYRYVVSQALPPGERVTVLSDAVLRAVRAQTQRPGAVRPFDSRLRSPDVLPERPPAVALHVSAAGRVVTVPVPVVQLGSDAFGRLYHVALAHGPDGRAGREA